jgi:CDP-glycerol glycerophosphotransferase (TagB/SpsB family)
VDVLITDYSSVTFDFSLMKGKNLILYPYDYEEYKKGRDFDYPYDDLIVGTKVYDFDSLLAAMVSGQNYMPEENRLRFVEECWGGHQSGACEKIGSFLISLDN